MHAVAAYTAALLLLFASSAGGDGKPSIRLRTAMLELDPARFAAEYVGASGGRLDVARQSSPATLFLLHRPAPSSPPPLLGAEKQAAYADAALEGVGTQQDPAGNQLFLVTFLGPNERAALRTVLQAHATAIIASYIPDNTWLVSADQAAATSAAALAGVQVVSYLGATCISSHYSCGGTRVLRCNRTLHDAVSSMNEQCLH